MVSIQGLNALHALRFIHNKWEFLVGIIMSQDVLFKVLQLTSPQSALVSYKDSSGQPVRGNLSLSNQARMQPASFTECLNKSLGGYLLADQVVFNGTNASAAYATFIKAAGDQSKRVFTSNITTAEIFSVSEGQKHTRIMTAYELLQAVQAQYKLTMMATVAKPLPILCNSKEDVLEALMSVYNQLKCVSYTAKLIVSPSDNSPSFTIHHVRNNSGSIDLDATKEKINSLTELDTLLNYGAVSVYPATTIRLSDLSVKSLVDRWTRIHPGKRHQALEHFFSSTVDQYQSLYGEGVICTDVKNGPNGVYEYGTYYRPLSKSKPIRAFSL